MISFVLLFLFFVVISLVSVFLLCIFLPSLNVNYDGLKSFIFSAEKLAEKDLKIMWQTKHLPWAPELSEKNKKLSIKKENTDGSVSAAWKTIFSKTTGKK